MRISQQDCVHSYAPTVDCLPSVLPSIYICLSARFRPQFQRPDSKRVWHDICPQLQPFIAFRSTKKIRGSFSKIFRPQLQQRFDSNAGGMSGQASYIPTPRTKAVKLYTIIHYIKKQKRVLQVPSYCCRCLGKIHTRRAGASLTTYLSRTQQNDHERLGQLLGVVRF